jgi:gliding motility-associated-like protein
MRLFNYILLFFVFGMSSVFACPTITISSTDVDCFLGTNGTASATISGTNAPFTITWSEGTTGSVSNGGSTSISGLAAGVYTIYVVDGIGCTSTIAVSVEDPDPVSGTIVTITNVNCNGGNDGIIDLAPSGGTPAYSFAWSNGSTTEDPTNFIQGIHSVVITDSKGCTSGSISAMVGEPASALTSSITGEDANCFGVSDGSVDLSPSGGTSPYTFVWDNGAVTEDLTGVPAGTYNVTITDNNGCTATNSITINEPTGITSSLSKTDVLCFNGSDGSVTLSVNGGTPPYGYQWANAASTYVGATQNLTNIPASTYFVTITDDKGCIHTDNITVDEPPLLTAVLTPRDILCFGDSTGKIDVVTTGGTPGYTYSWSNGATTQNIANLKLGDYYVTITDVNGCTYYDSANISQPQEALYDYYSVKIPMCYGDSNGQVDFVVEGGTQPYNHVWSRGDTTLTLFNAYFDTVLICTTTDFNGCILIDTVRVEQPDSMAIDSVVTDVTCFGFSDGTIDVTVTGGNAQYDYYWTNSTYQLSENVEDLIGYPGDTYTVVVKDTNFCEATREFVITEPPILQGYLDVQDITCYGYDDGIIEAMITGGNIGPYTYVWSNSDTTKIIDSLSPGVYSVDVYDTKFCTIFLEDTVIEPDPIVGYYVLDPLSCKDIADAAIEMFPTGGHGGFSYLWTNRTDITPRIEELPFGVYPVRITDYLGCFKDTVGDVPEVFNPCLTPPTAFTPEGDGYNDIWYLENIELYPNCTVEVFNKWGKTVFKSTGYNEPWDGTFKGRKLPTGTYYYAITLTDDAVYSGPITIVR